MRACLATLVVASLMLAAVGCAEGSGDSPLVDGRHFGYVRSVDTDASPATIDVDVAEFLSGEEANAAAVEDGVIPPGEPVPNDYYIRNEDKDLVTVAVADDVAVTHIQCPDSCTEGVPGQFDAFAASFDAPSDGSLAAEYRGAQSQYWITVEGGEVVAIDEQYVP